MRLSCNTYKLILTLFYNETIEQYYKKPHPYLPSPLHLLNIDRLYCNPDFRWLFNMGCNQSCLAKDQVNDYLSYPDINGPGVSIDAQHISIHS